MAKLGCTCGHVISTTASPNEVEGWLLSDKNREGFFAELTLIVDGMLAGLKQDGFDAWRAERLGSSYPADTSPAETLCDALDDALRSRVLDLLQCDRCGRLWVQEANGINRYRSYAPDAVWTPEHKALG